MLRHQFCALFVIFGCYAIGADGFPDWLVDKVDTPTTVKTDSKGSVTITNGLISRTFALLPDFATIDYYSHEQKSSLLRAISPEMTISLDGIVYDVGGLNTSIPRAYLNRTALAEDMTINEGAFHFSSYEIHNPEAPFPYTPRRGAPKNISWPPKGKRLDVHFKAPYWAPIYHQMVTVTIHYEMYDGIPLMSKWATISSSAPSIDSILVVLSVESLAVNWQWSSNGYGWLYVRTDQAHSTKVRWAIDESANKMPGSFQPSVNCTYSLVPKLVLQTNFATFKVMELVLGPADAERFGLAKRKMMRLLAPHTQENPLFCHTIHGKSKDVRYLIDQMADVGFELLVFSFGSAFDFESHNETYIEQLGRDVAYAKARGIEVGGYDLISLTRRVKPEWMAKNNKYPSACFASGWYDYLLKSILTMMDKTGMSNIETDGPYSGYTCSSTEHAHHEGYEDSVYKQTMKQNEFYLTLRKRAVYINQPDNYFYQGGSKTAMGYNENQYSLPRWQDLSISRQGMFDDTFHYIPTVGWMFVPLVQYHAGGAAAMFEPLSDHSVEYNWALGQYMGSGVGATYRGYRLYDGPKTRAIVKKWVDFYKKYRDIVTSDIIHVRRADMQSVDCLMHVNPALENKALAMVFNPTNTVQAMNLSLPLYYSGIAHKALVSQEGGSFVTYTLDRQYNIVVSVKLPPLGITWYLLKNSPSK